MIFAQKIEIKMIQFYEKMNTLKYSFSRKTENLASSLKYH